MGVSFWIRRYLTVAAALFVIIGGVQLLRGNPIRASIEHGLIWSAISATVFTVSRFFQARRGLHCALCKDIPEG